MVSRAVILGLVSYLVFESTGNLLVAALAGVGVTVIVAYLDSFLGFEVE